MLKIILVPYTYIYIYILIYTYILIYILVPQPTSQVKQIDEREVQVSNDTILRKGTEEILKHSQRHAGLINNPPHANHMMLCISLITTKDNDQ